MDFKEQYFQIWTEVWNLHKKYHGVAADDEKAWQELDKECELLDKKYQGKEQKFLQSLLLSVAAELERSSKNE